MNNSRFEIYLKFTTLEQFQNEHNRLWIWRELWQRLSNRDSKVYPQKGNSGARRSRNAVFLASLQTRDKRIQNRAAIKNFQVGELMRAIDIFNAKQNKSWAETATFTMETFDKMLRRYNELRKKTEFKINGVTINAADYEDITERNRRFLPTGFRALLNVKRTVYDKTFEPLPTDLIVFDIQNPKNQRSIFAGGHKKEWKEFWNEFIDEKRITSKERLLFIAAARSPSITRGEITEDSRRYLEAEIHAATQGKIKFSELERMEDWRVAYLWKEIFVDKKPIENL